MSESEQIKKWQSGVAAIGFLVWLLLLSNTERINAYGWTGTYKFVAGYVLGFLIAFSGYVFWEVVTGRGKQFLDPHPLFRWVSYFVLAIILLSGLASLGAEVFGNTDWRYNIGSLLGGVVVGIGLLPYMEQHDRAKKAKQAA